MIGTSHLRRFRCRGLLLLAVVGGALAAAPAAASSVVRPDPPGGPVGGPACRAPLGEVLVAGTIDPGRAGLVPRFLAQGFESLTVAVRAEGSCDGVPAVPARDVILDSTWQTAAGDHLQVSQRQTGASVANVLDTGWASFMAGGYAFTLSAQPPDPFLGPPSAATTGVRPPTAGFSHPIPPPTGDARELLEAAIAQLGPELSLPCFFRRTAGEWADLGVLGVGDPRPALPAGFTEAYVTLQYLARPMAGCPAPAVDPGDGLSFAASFADFSDGRIEVAGWAVAVDAGQQPGRLGEEGAYWSAGRHGFGVWGALAGGPLGIDRARALALALDPGFARACLLRDRLLTEAELPALGLHAAQAPAGYGVLFSSLRAEELTGACGPDVSYRGGIFLSWLFGNGGELFIEAQALRGGAAGTPTPAATWRLSPVPGRELGSPRRALPGVEGGTSGEPYLAWTDARGTSYWVYGYSATGGEGPSREHLLFVARSLDSTFAGE